MLNNQTLELLNDLAILFPAFLLVFTCRGFFKALTAKIMGDDTAQESGFLTFNPVVHVNLFGFLIMLFFLFFLGGLLLGTFPRGMLFILLILIGVRWTYPVPIDEGNFKHHTLGVILTTLAGPIGNFVLALFFLYVLTYFPYQLFPQYVFITLVSIFRAVIELAVFFCVLDLIPLPPFDGGRLLQFILPKSLDYVISWLEEYSIYVLLGLFFLPGISDVFFKLISILSVFIKQILLFLVF